VRAQDEPELRNAIPVHAFKFSPFHLINFYPTIQCAYEFRVSKKWTVQLDGGVAVNTRGSEDQNKDITNKKGYKLKLEPRYYFDWGRQRRTAFYGATELYFNNISFDHEYEQTECFDETCSDKYTRRYYYRGNYQEGGVAFKMGMLLYLFKNFMIDYNVGLGVRSINYTFPSYIHYETPHFTDGFHIPRMEDRVVGTPIFNFRIGYRIR
jgi:hypothetical protein